MMWRALALALLLFIFVLASTSHRVVVVGTSTLATSTLGEIEVPSLAAAVAATGTFDHVGTLVFYPNNVGPVPYLFYQNEKGDTVSKALTFDALPPTDLSSWTGARVEVIGIIDREHVVVSRISHIAAP